ncbi:ankyrin repeat-containing protein At2g01680-like [Zingiber officinale]|uniref:PGG domain-containing protein n=1 Tax=Zingiber officinale TaxID=94328 RepID=A0A8J5L3W8_ZINOF|nr:ankyrin repeat-containing protein At2g01680-like [Zingiber officinale]KAG6499705.1 hypothetical protein ZIOFF_039496 [Zingiber officinale]
MEEGRSNDIMDPELWKAATSGDATFIEGVIRTDKMRLGKVTIDGNSALHIAAKHGYVQIARKVSELEEPSLLQLPNESGDTPLHLASAAGHLDIVNLFIERHERLRQHHRPSSGGVEEDGMPMDNEIGNTARHAATIGGHVSVVERLPCAAPESVPPGILKEHHRPSSDGVEEDGMSMDSEIGNTDLNAATIRGHVSVVERRPPLVNLVHRRMMRKKPPRPPSDGVEKDGMLMDNKIGNTALHAAIIGGHVSVVERLLSSAPKLATMTNRYWVSALYMAAERDLPDIVEKILAVSDEEVSHEGPRGQMALHAAVLRSHKITNMILDKNIPSCLRHQDEDSKSTPLHFAAAQGDVAMLRLLLERDATAGYMKDEHGFAIIHIAASVGDRNMIEEILVRCPDALEQKNNKGRNFVHVAVKKKNLNVVEYVLNSSPSAKELLNEQDRVGNTPLHLAVLAKDQKMIRVLLSSRIANSALMNSSGFTPVDLASLNFRTGVSLRMYNIMTDLISYGSRFSPQRVDHIRNHMRKSQDEEIDRYRALTNNLAIVAVLIATVTFAAAFTLPGGYRNDSGSDEGMAILSSRAAFKAFLISDTLAMASSITVALVLIYSGSLDHDVRLQSLMTAMKLVWVAVGSLSVAFATGVYSVVGPDSEWVAILVILIVCSPPLVAILVAYRHSSGYLKMKLGYSLGQKRVNRDPATGGNSKSVHLRILQREFIRSQTFDHMKFTTPHNSQPAQALSPSASQIPSPSPSSSQILSLPPSPTTIRNSPI